ncbi:MAG: glycosyltransferase family 4 protein [Sphingomonas phyllosphaerae]
MLDSPAARHSDDDTPLTIQRYLRICLVIEAGGGGAGRHVLDLARALHGRGHDVHLIYSPHRAEPRHLAEIAALPVTSEPVTMRRAPGVHDVFAARALTAALRRAGPFDIVHGHSSKAGALVRLADVGPAKRVYTPHAFRGLDPGVSLPARLMFNGAEIVLGAARTDALIAVSSEELAFARKLRIATGRCHLIRNGIIDVPAVTRAQARAALGLPDDAPVIGFVGRLSYQKAPERFVEAMRRVMTQVPDLRAVILGDGECAAAVERDLAASGHAARFIWKRAARAQELMPAFDAVMMTSRYEGLSYVLLESLAAHVPIVTTDVAGARDVIGRSRCGTIVPNDATVIERLADTAILIGTDRGARAAMAAATVWRSRELNGMRMIYQTEMLYRQLVEPR